MPQMCEWFVQNLLRINKIWQLFIPFFIRAPQNAPQCSTTTTIKKKQPPKKPTVFCATITHKLLRKIPHYNGLKRVTAWLIHLAPCPTVATWQLCQKRERGVRGSSTVCVTLRLTLLSRLFSLSSVGFLWNNVAPSSLLPIQFHSKSLPISFFPAHTLKQTPALRSSTFNFSEDK